jgi:hypothetical protein
MGLRLTHGMTDAALISRRYLAWVMGMDPERGAKLAGRWLTALERAKVIRRDGAMPQRGMPNGTALWQPFDYDLAELWDGLRAVPDSGEEAAA